MSDQYVGEIRAFANTSLPSQDWLACDGSLQAINRYLPLFSIIGTLYGGDGMTTFGLPNLNSRAAMKFGSPPGDTTDYSLGGLYGEASVVLSEANLPFHTHQLIKKNTDAGNAGKIYYPTLGTDLGGLSAATGSVGYQSGSRGAPDTSLYPKTITHTGESQPHENRQPFLAMYFAIAYHGLLSE